VVLSLVPSRRLRCEFHRVCIRVYRYDIAVFRILLIFIVRFLLLVAFEAHTILRLYAFVRRFLSICVCPCLALFHVQMFCLANRNEQLSTGLEIRLMTPTVSNNLSLLLILLNLR